MKTDRNTLILFGGAAVLALVLLKKVTALPAAALNALASAGSAIGSGLFTLFHPNAIGETVFYTITFPDGSRHAIASSTVNSSGRFAYALPPATTTKVYQMLTGQDGKRYAALA